MKIKALPAAEEDASERDAFLKLAGHIMRRLLIHRGAVVPRAQKLDVNELDSCAEILAQVEDLLAKPQKLDPRLRTVVELRAFEGMTAVEAAGLMVCPVRSVHKYWSFARHWLAIELGDARWFVSVACLSCATGTGPNTKAASRTFMLLRN